MSYYYKYTFASPEPIYAVVREELKSYFDTGMVDDLMFPTYLNKCLDKLGQATYLITQDVMHLRDFEARLPDNFHGVREAWLCTDVGLRSYQEANSFYSQAMSTTIQVSPVIVGGNECNCDNKNCVDPNCDGYCLPHLEQAVYKTNHSQPRSFRRQYLLKPGNISAEAQCDQDYGSSYGDAYYHSGSVARGSSAYDSFDIRGNKFVTNFRQGIVNLIFYATDYDKLGNQMVPNNYRIKEFVEAFIKFKMFETISNQVTDETFNQIMQKVQYYKSLADEAFILADIEIKKETSYEKQRRIKKSLKRHQRYELPNRTTRSMWRRSI